MKLMKLFTLTVCLSALPMIAMEQNEINKTDKLRRFYHHRTNSKLVERHNGLVMSINHFNGVEDERKQLEMKLSLVDQEIDRRIKEDDMFERRAREDQNKKVYE